PVVKLDATARKVGVGRVAEVAERNCGAMADEELALRNAICALTGVLNATMHNAQSHAVRARSSQEPGRVTCRLPFIRDTYRRVCLLTRHDRRFRDCRVRPMSQRFWQRNASS